MWGERERELRGGLVRLRRRGRWWGGDVRGAGVYESFVDMDGWCLVVDGMETKGKEMDRIGIECLLWVLVSVTNIWHLSSFPPSSEKVFAPLVASLRRWHCVLASAFLYVAS